MSLFDNIQKPETTTIIRWLLRVILVVFLAWLVRRKPEDEEEQDEEDEAAKANDRRFGGLKPRQAGVKTMDRMNRMQPRTRDPYSQQNYPSSVRQRRLGGGGADGAQGAQDFDAVIEKMSKPKDMWEVRKSGEAPQIFKKPSFSEQDCSPSAPSSAAPVREPLKLRRSSDTPKDAAKGKEHTLHGHERPVTFICWNRDCNLLFTCGKDKIVCVWSFPDGEQLGIYKGHQGAVWACSVTSDSRWLVTSGADRFVIVWEARASRELARVELPGVVRCVEWASSGGSAEASEAERFVTCHNRTGKQPAGIMVWRFDGTTIEEQLKIETLPTTASQVRWGLGDQFVASAHDNGEIIFWRTDDGTEVCRHKAHDDAISNFDFSSDRQLLASCSRVDSSVRIWDLGEGATGGEWTLLYRTETDRPLNAVALGPVTRSALAGPPGQRPTRCCVIAAGGQDVRDVTTSSSTSDQFSTILLRLGSEETLPASLQENGFTKGHFGPVHTLAFAQNGSAIASGSEDGCVRLHVFEKEAEQNEAKA